MNDAGADPGEAEEADGPELPPVPDALLAPLLDSAAEALRHVAPADLPPAARRLRSFDRRGLATPAARQQLRKLLEEDQALLISTMTRFRARPEVGPLAEAWDAAVAAGGDAPVNLVADTAADGRLPLLASVLTSGLPDLFEFGLGLVVAQAAAGEREAGAADAVRAATAGQVAAEEARRRADAARAAAEAEAARLDQALRDERQARRDQNRELVAAEARLAELAEEQAGADEQTADAERREADAAARIGEADRRVAAAERRAADADRRADAAAAQAAAAEDRARRAEREAAFAQEEAQAAAATPAPAPPGVDRAVLDQIARAAEDLAAGVRRLTDRSPPRAPAPPRTPVPPRHPNPPRPAVPPRPAPARGAARPHTPPVGRSRRAPVRLPPGMLQDDPAAIEAMVRTKNLALIVDGYNVSMLAWPGVTAAEQRERLCDALAELQLRFRCEVTVVFDGADVPGVRPLRRRGLRVVFSAAGQEADDVVVGEVMFRPDEVPVIVASSDREVRAAAEAEGAAVLTADELLALMRR